MGCICEEPYANLKPRKNPSVDNKNVKQKHFRNSCHKDFSRIDNSSNENEIRTVNQNDNSQFSIKAENIQSTSSCYLFESSNDDIKFNIKQNSSSSPPPSSSLLWPSGELSTTTKSLLSSRRHSTPNTGTILFRNRKISDASIHDRFPPGDDDDDDNDYSQQRMLLDGRGPLDDDQEQPQDRKHSHHLQRNHKQKESQERHQRNQQPQEQEQRRIIHQQDHILDDVGHLILSKLVQLSNNLSNKSCVTNNSHNLARHSLSLYAASSVILALFYLTAAAATEFNPMSPPHLQSSIHVSDDMFVQVKTGECSKARFNAPPIQVPGSFNESCSDKEILDYLLEEKRYDKRLLPPVNDEDFCCGLSSPEMAYNMTSLIVGPKRPHNRGTLTVNVNVLLLSLASPDESSLKYEVEFLLNQHWKDPRLQYGNQSRFEYLNAIHHHQNIWLPDTYFIMHGDFKDPINPMHFALRIYRNGTITYSMRRHLILSCQGSLNIFPFDDPLCSFAMESISYELSQIKYVWKNEEATLRKSPSLTTLNAYLIKNQTIPCLIKNSWRGNYSCLKVDLIFTRDRAFYFTTVFIPGIILVTSSFITFWLEWNAVPARSMIGNYSCLKVDLTFTRDRAFYFTTVFIPGIILVTSSFITFWLEWNAVPARVMIGVTTMLNFFTTSNSFRGTLPVVSNLTAMNVWDGVCMCFIYASLLEFVCVNYVGRKRPLHNVVYRPGENPVTQRLPAVLSRIGIILASPLEVIEQEFRAAISSDKRKAREHQRELRRRGQQQASEQPTKRPTTRQFQAVFDDPLLSPQSGMGLNPKKDAATSIAATTVKSLKRSPEPEQQRNANRQEQQEDPGATQPLIIKTTATVITSSITEPKTTSPPILSHCERIIEPKGGQEKEQKRLLSSSPQSITTTTATDTPISQTLDGNETGKIIVTAADIYDDIEKGELLYPVKPPRRKSTQVTSFTTTTLPSGEKVLVSAVPEDRKLQGAATGEKKQRDGGGPNEIVACTSCGGGTSPCTHSANNGCATDPCFVQVRKKEPPHPIRVAKTIDVIARITFPTAYAIFLIFFFIHYKAFT